MSFDFLKSFLSWREGWSHVKLTRTRLKFNFCKIDISATCLHVFHLAQEMSGKNNTAISNSQTKPCAHTDIEAGAWWMVDLKGTYNISRVEITILEDE